MTTIGQKAAVRQYIFTFAAIVLAIVMVFIFSGSKNATREQAIASEPSFGSYNYNVMKKDTFVSLITKAYGNAAIVSYKEQVLYVDIKNSGPGVNDFFNGNAALLQYHLGDFGFEIAYSRQEQTVHAAFKIDEKNGVHVPNDILIRLMDKTQNK